MTPLLEPQGVRSVSIAEEDSVLGTEYVVVEKRTVEVNALADGMSTSDNR